jgi:hypothetical protein
MSHATSYFIHQTFLLFSKCSLLLTIAKWKLRFENKKCLFEQFSQLSASGDSGMPEVVADPQGDVSKIFQNLGVCVVQQCAKIRQQGIQFLLEYEKKNSFNFLLAFMLFL